MSGDLAPLWRWNFTANADWARSESVTGTGFSAAAAQARLNANDPAFNPSATFAAGVLTPLADDRTETRTSSADAQALVNGRLFQLPAGPVTLSARIGAAAQGIEGESFRAGVTDLRDLSRTSGNGQVSFDIPIARRSRDVLAALGDLSLNLNAEAETVSDFGTLTTLGAGLSWTPLPAVQFIASWQQREVAPGLTQLGDPQSLDPNSRVFDFRTGRTVDITRITGGNPDLLAERRSTLRLGLTVRPFEETDLVFAANYTRLRIDDPIAQFPTATPEIEAAFSSRFIRDLGGNLTSIDSRPINFARAEQQTLRWGVTIRGRSRARPRRAAGRRSGSGCASPASAARARPKAAAAGAAVAAKAASRRRGWPWRRRRTRRLRRRTWRRCGGGFGGRGGRINFSLFHNWRCRIRC